MAWWDAYAWLTRSVEKTAIEFSSIAASVITIYMCLAAQGFFIAQGFIFAPQGFLAAQGFIIFAAQGFIFLAEQGFLAAQGLAAPAFCPTLKPF